MDGGAPEQLIAVDGFLLGLAWTPSGEEIVVSRGHIFNQTLWRVPTLGGAPRQLPGLGENAYFPVISPARGRLVYERWLANVNIYRYDLPGSPQQAGAPQKLIATTQVDFQPQISPGGRRIAFVSARSGHDEIWVCDRDGSNAVQLTAYEGTGNPAVPQWSRDGSLIAFDCSVSGNFDVFVINSEGGSPRQLTTYDGEDSRPTWSQDGLWIYFRIHPHRNVSGVENASGGRRTCAGDEERGLQSCGVTRWEIRLCGVSTSFRYTLWVVASRLRNRNVRLRESCEWPPSRPTREFIAVAAFGRQLRESDALRSPTSRQSSNLGIHFLVDAFARPQHLVAT